MGTCLSAFPNFFMLMGPNTLSGHLSVIYTSECQINYVLRVIAPIMSYLRPSILSTLRTSNDIVQIKPEAEAYDLALTQVKAKRLVWATGCASWFIEPRTGRNSIMYPDYQYRLWLRSIFVAWNDWDLRQSLEAQKPRKTQGLPAFGALFVAAIVGAVAVRRKSW